MSVEGRKSMSLFLGPIHYWLYNKIGNQERLTGKIADKAKEKGWIREVYIYTKEFPELESVIDESNIHGWLQARIADAEIRYAKLITDITNSGIELEELKPVAYEFGVDNAVNYETDATEIYQYFEDFFVNGMPCDHVNMVTNKSATEVEWEMVQDIHEQYFGNMSEKYYVLRKSIMDGLLEKTEYEVVMKDIYHYIIKRK